MSPNVTLVLHGLSRLSEAEYIDFVTKFTRLGKKDERCPLPTAEEVREAIARVSGSTLPPGCPACHHINRDAVKDWEKSKVEQAMARLSRTNGDTRPDPDSGIARVMQTMAVNQRRPID